MKRPSRKSYGTALYVVSAAAYRASRGRRPVLGFREIGNPRDALCAAKQELEAPERAQRRLFEGTLTAEAWDILYEDWSVGEELAMFLPLFRKQRILDEPQFRSDTVEAIVKILEDLLVELLDEHGASRADYEGSPDYAAQDMTNRRMAELRFDCLKKFETWRRGPILPRYAVT